MNGLRGDEERSCTCKPISNHKVFILSQICGFNFLTTYPSNTWFARWFSVQYSLQHDIQIWYPQQIIQFSPEHPSQ